MDKIEKNKKMTFKDYYSSLSTEEKKVVRQSFLEKSGVAYPTFFSKLRRDNFTNLERGLIEDICETNFRW